jgi:HEAT repeat protein
LDPDQKTVGWDALNVPCQLFPHVAKDERKRAKADVEALIKEAFYGALAPRGEEERRLLDLLRALPLLPPWRIDAVPEDGALPDDYQMASRLRGDVRGLPTEDVRAAAALLRSADPRVRVTAALIAEQMAPDDGFGESNRRRDILRPALLEMTNDPHPVLRRLALGRLGVLSRGDPGAGILDELAAHMVDHSPVVRVATARSLGQLGEAAAVPAVLRGLLQMLHEEDESALGAGVALASAVAPALTDAHIDRVHELLNHPAADVARDAARAIGAAGPRAARPAIVETLLDLFHDGERQVREAAVTAYGRLGVVPNERALNELGRLLDDAEVTGSVIETLTRLGPAAATHRILTGLAARYRQASEWQKGVVGAALASMGQAAFRDDVFAALGDALTSGSADGAREAFRIGGQLGPGGLARMLTIVADRLGEPAVIPRRLALKVVGDSGAVAATPEFLDRVVALLGHDSAPIRATAAEAVELVGPAAATPRILELLNALKGDLDRDVRFRAEEALYRLTKRR